MSTRRNFIKQSVLGGFAIAGNAFDMDTLPANSSSSDYYKKFETMKLATVSWTFGLEDLDDLFKEVSKLGFEYLQFCGDFKKYEAVEVLAKADQYGVKLASYDPAECKPESKENATLENSVDFFKQVIDYAEKLKVPMVTLQGLSFWTRDEQTYDKAFTQITEAVRQLAAYADDKDVLTSYEAVCHYETPWMHTSAELLKLKKESGATNLKLVLDSFHMNINEPNMIASLHEVGKDLLYSYHVSDSGRGGIGTGHINFQSQYKALEALGFDGLVCFEIVTPEVRPYKLPMNEEQFKKFREQAAYSLNTWKSFG